MPTKIVNLNGSLNLQDDEFTVGLDGFTELINLRQENGKLVRRLGTGALKTHTTYEIDGMEIFVHRKLQSALIDSSSSNYTFAASGPTLTLSATTGVTIPGSTSKDLTTIFKVGDTIVFVNTDSNTNDHKPFVISAITSTVITFENAPSNQGAISSGTITVGFAYSTENLTTPGNDAVSPLALNDAYGCDGRAFLISQVNTDSSATNKQISITNPLDFTDNFNLKDFGAATTDMHIRVNAYADAVRFACGLEHSPRIFKYVNRHFFNGMLKSVVNTNADGLYPRWIIDTAIPSLPAGTFDSQSIVADSAIGDTSDSNTVKLIDGTLNLKQDFYDYKFVPVYDGGQEDILDNAVLIESTSAINKKKEEDSGKLSVERSCVKITSRIDLTKLNPRTSAINVYRSTNGGTYYKIKSMYMGDNDPSQKTITARHTRDLLWFQGSATLAADTLDDAELIVSGFKFAVDDGTGVNDYNSTGYKAIQVESFKEYFETSTLVTDDSRFSPEYYGSHDLGIWNKKCEETDIIFANNGEARGGSADGGWYFAEATEHVVSGHASSTIDNELNTTVLNNSDTGPSQPFTGLATSGQVATNLEWSFHAATITGDCISSVILTDTLEAADYIVSGWIRAEGFDSPSVEWRVWINETDDSALVHETGQQVIAQGIGGDVNQNIDKWRWFQYKFSHPDATVTHLYVKINSNNIDTVENSNYIRIKNLSVRKQTIADDAFAGFKITDGLVGFAGTDVLVDVDIAALGVPQGALKGNRINDATDVAYPTEKTEAWAYISDNVGPFIKLAGEAPGTPGDSDSDETYFLGISNYQFYADDVNTAQHVFVDFFDPGLPDGERHPYEASKSLDVKFKYSTMLSGRQCVADVKISSEGEVEEYPNFVMFSGSNSPDIIPVSNFIQLQDLQGGEILGIETLMSDIVVFMTNGIFRLSVPSDDPSNWSLIEAHPNIGALHDRGIAKAPNGIYFCGRSDVYFLDSGFQATPITGPIRDAYQTKTANLSSGVDTNLNLFHDVKYNRLYMNYTPTASTIMYVFDINRGIWYQDTYLGYSNYGINHFTKDNLNKTIFIERYTTSTLQYAEGSNYNDTDSGSNNVMVTMKTGKKIFSTLDKKSIVRRVNTILTRSGGTATLDLDVITDQGTVSKNEYLVGTQSTRISNRGKFVQIEINNDNNDGNDDGDEEYEINHVDVEYE